jgi:hypothetical protein
VRGCTVAQCRASPKCVNFVQGPALGPCPGLLMPRSGEARRNAVLAQETPRCRMALALAGRCGAAFDSAPRPVDAFVRASSFYAA